MELDPLTFAAQILNFLLLLLFLKRFLFDRVRRVMEERAARAGARLREAEEARLRAEEAEAEARERALRLETEREALLAASRAAAAAELGAAREAARTAGEAEREAWLRDLEGRREAFLAALRGGAATWLGELSRRALADLAGEELGPAILAAFLARLRGLGPGALAEFRAAALSAGGGLRVESGFLPSPAEEEELRSTLSAALGLELRFVEKRLRPERPGLAVEADSFRLAWTLEEYVLELEGRMAAGYGEALRGAAHG